MQNTGHMRGECMDHLIMGSGVAGKVDVADDDPVAVFAMHCLDHDQGDYHINHKPRPDVSHSPLSLTDKVKTQCGE